MELAAATETMFMPKNYFAMIIKVGSRASTCGLCSFYLQPSSKSLLCDFIKWTDCNNTQFRFPVLLAMPPARLYWSGLHFLIVTGCPSSHVIPLDERDVSWNPTSNCLYLQV